MRREMLSISKIPKRNLAARTGSRMQFDFPSYPGPPLVCLSNLYFSHSQFGRVFVREGRLMVFCITLYVTLGANSMLLMVSYCIFYSFIN